MISFSFISLLSAIISLIAILIVFGIFKRVLQEKYRRPWLYIGISTIFLVGAQVLRFIYSFLNMTIANKTFTEATIYILDFLSITILTYALILEFLILKYYKGKFVKMKFIPVQEGSIGGEIDLNVSKSKSYLALKKDRNYLLTEFSEATKKGFEGFLITEDNPQETRNKYKLPKTPMAWLTHIDASLDSDYLKDSLDVNSDIIDPLQLNNLINYIDNFLEQAQNPFVLVDLNLIFRSNNYTIVLEFLKYISSKIEKFDGILICMLNIDILKKDQISELQSFLLELE